jgi:hypothetical protein
MDTLKAPLRGGATSSASKAVKTQTPLALMSLQRSIDLAGLACIIAADRDLRHRVTAAASRESGWPLLKVEEAIVLLGLQRLYALVSDAAETLQGRTQ